MDVLEKVDKIKELIKKELGDLDDSKIHEMISHVGHLVYTKNWKTRARKLTKEEVKLFELLNRHGYNPNTVYKWFLVEKSPEDLKQKIKEGVFSFNRAYGTKRELTAYDNVSKEEFLEAVIRCVELFYIEPDISKQDDGGGF